MNKDEALRLALEALEKISMGGDPRWADQAITCLRLVIDAENISSKPMAWEQFYPEMGKPKLAYLSPTESPENACYIPPQRTWVGLTDKDWNRSKHNYDFQKGVDWAESILKEKNA